MEIRTIQYYKTLKPIILDESFEIKEGTKVLFNFSEGQIYNVRLVDGNDKRYFWVHASELKHYKTVKEKWLKKDIQNYNLDLNEKWFEFDKQQKNSLTKEKRKKILDVKENKIPRTTKKTNTKSFAGTKSKQESKTKIPTTNRRVGNSIRVSTKKRKVTTKRTGKNK